MQDKFEESLRSAVPYFRGDTDEFTIDLEVQDRVRMLTEVARTGITELNLTERVVDDLVVPQSRRI